MRIATGKEGDAGGLRGRYPIRSLCQPQSPRITPTLNGKGCSSADIYLAADLVVRQLWVSRGQQDGVWAGAVAWCMIRWGAQDMHMHYGKGYNIADVHLAADPVIGGC